MSALNILAQPETEPLGLVGIFSPKPTSPLVFVNTMPATTNNSTHHHHHHYTPFCLTRQTWNQAIVAWFWVFGINSLPPLTFANTNICDHCHIKRDTPPPPSTTQNHYLTWQMQNQPTVAWFWVSVHNPLPCFVFANAWPQCHHYLIYTIPPPSHHLSPSPQRHQRTSKLECAHMCSNSINNSTSAAAAATMVVATGTVAAGAGYYGPLPCLFLHFLSNIYMYIQYFNNNKLQVLKVLQVS